MHFRTLATFPTTEQAEVVRLPLHAAGIPSFLETVMVEGMVCGAKLNVAESDEPRALTVLAESTSASGSVDGTWVCTRCGEEVPQAFDVCWSCQSPVGCGETKIQHAPSSTPQNSTDDDSHYGYETTCPGDEMAWRAMLAAIAGISVLPAIGNIYSIWTLLRLMYHGPQLSRSARHCVYVAWTANLLMIVTFAWLWTRPDVKWW